MSIPTQLYRLYRLYRLCRRTKRTFCLLAVMAISGCSVTQTQAPPAGPMPYASKKAPLSVQTQGQISGILVETGSGSYRYKSSIAAMKKTINSKTYISIHTTGSEVFWEIEKVRKVTYDDGAGRQIAQSASPQSSPDIICDPLYNDCGGYGGNGDGPEPVSYVAVDNSGCVDVIYCGPTQPDQGIGTGFIVFPAPELVYCRYTFSSGAIDCESSPYVFVSGPKNLLLAHSHIPAYYQVSCAPMTRTGIAFMYYTDPAAGFASVGVIKYAIAVVNVFTNPGNLTTYFGAPQPPPSIPPAQITFHSDWYAYGESMPQFYIGYCNWTG